MSTVMTVSRTRTQSGFSLVELMVALLMGSIVVLAATNLFTTNQRTFQLQQSVSDIQQQGRFALDYISQDLRRAGYRLGAGFDGVLLTAETINGVVVPASSNNTGFNRSDRLSIQYAGVVDCEGDTVAVEEIIGSTYWVNNNGQLMCMGTVDPATNGLPLVENVESFQVLAGIGDGSVDFGVTWVDRYVPLNAVGTGFVTGINASMLIAADGPATSIPQQARTILLLDEVFQTGAAPLAENRIRRQFNLSIALRNYDVTEMPSFAGTQSAP